MTSLLCVIVITHYNIYILPFMEWDQDVPLSTRGTVSITMCVTLGNILQLMYRYRPIVRLQYQKNISNLKAIK